MVQNHGVSADMLEQQRLDEVRLQTVGARQASRRDVLRDVRVPAEVVCESCGPRRGKDVCLAASRDRHAGHGAPASAREPPETNFLPKMLRLARRVHGTEREAQTRKVANELITQAREIHARARTA